MYDLIGDIHGHADALVKLLHELGYDNHTGVYRHPKRQAVFLGDFIDRGPKIRETLEIVRPMIESGAAQAVMGPIALALVVRKPMATHLVQEEMGQEVIRAAAVVAIGAVGARVSRHN